MSSSFEKYQKKRLISSYFSVVLSTTLVLFLLGILGLLVLNTKKVADYYKEKIAVTVYLKDSAKDVEIKQLQKTLALAEYTKSAEYVSKETAAANLTADIGEDFVEYLGENPLLNSLDVYINSKFVTGEQLEAIAAEISEKNFVKEVSFDKPLVAKLNANIKRIGFGILIACVFFAFVAALLINSSIRLSVYAKRFTIKTMQMVGATKGFIRKPFIWNSIKMGIIAAILALAGMAGVLYYVNKSLPQLQLANDKILIGSVFAGILVIGILITLVSSFFATQRFLNLRTDQLYY
ncbi:permease-like cell division protein FtsX [Kordia algicida OT-1]|uniref:Cell division protein FtsX n=1 Tax=Kordia algicida OT-1 TaxID=391587 RepID=A9DKZ8_9FLAO|nr:permease-like cell division protein FtsX [Kordia algicida]EDP98441.1 putative cell division protein [Kordia algicida OT-1]